MLKRIRVQQLQVGMHLKEFCGSWMDHPFWRTGFVIKDPQDIALILASKITEVWIDASKGDDVPAVHQWLSRHPNLRRRQRPLRCVRRYNRFLRPRNLSAQRKFAWNPRLPW